MRSTLVVVAVPGGGGAVVGVTWHGRNLHVPMQVPRRAAGYVTAREGQPRRWMSWPVTGLASVSEIRTLPIDYGLLLARDHAREGSGDGE